MNLPISPIIAQLKLQNENMDLPKWRDFVRLSETEAATEASSKESEDVVEKPSL